MDTMNIALPENMKQFVQEQAAAGGYSSVSEYVRDLIRTDQKETARAALEAEVLKGLHSGESSPMTDQDWHEIRSQIRRRHAGRKQA
ncbi:MAG: type II toxin-antitoxin system ParD family antitoxin [Planctomycetes bacterium]|nr:type II toxin-antitoxin system ParD family antitoxin [Planctomycetota bacterium]